MNTTELNIREQVLSMIVSDYIKIFGLDEEDRSIVYENISKMDDTKLWNEILYIQQFYESVNKTYQKWLFSIFQEEEESEKNNLNTSLTLNF
jgi:hypothetical protein